MSSELKPDLIARLWAALSGDPGLTDAVQISGPEGLLPAVFDVTGLATGAVGVASLAAAHLLSARTGEPLRPVGVDRRTASAAFVSELLFTPLGWERPPIWDPLAGDYRAGDGWIKLHTNYRHHRAAALAVLGAVEDRESAGAVVRQWSAHDLQDAIVHNGGCAAAMNTREEWLGSAAGAATVGEPAAHIEYRAGSASPDPGRPTRPLSGIRVLDLTRVIAGPVCTRFLAAYGADVLRIDPPGFEEVGALLPETTAGKRCAALDLGAPDDHAIFQGLLRQADVLVTGLRPGALERLGYDSEHLQRLNPGLIVASLDAYGWSGPWAGRRGFDSLVQMSSGIAAAGAAQQGSDRPKPLPAQALDHGTGYVLAGAICEALTQQVTTGDHASIRCSLVGTANLLFDYATPDGMDRPQPEWSPADLVPATTVWGPAQRAPVPGRIAGVEPRLTIEAGPPGRHEPAWSNG